MQQLINHPYYIEQSDYNLKHNSQYKTANNETGLRFRFDNSLFIIF